MPKGSSGLSCADQRANPRHKPETACDLDCFVVIVESQRFSVDRVEKRPRQLLCHQRREDITANAGRDGQETQHPNNPRSDITVKKHHALTRVGGHRVREQQPGSGNPSCEERSPLLSLQSQLSHSTVSQRPSDLHARRDQPRSSRISWLVRWHDHLSLGASAEEKEQFAGGLRHVPPRGNRHARRRSMSRSMAALLGFPLRNVSTGCTST